MVAVTIHISASHSLGYQMEGFESLLKMNAFIWTSQKNCLPHTLELLLSQYFGTQSMEPFSSISIVCELRLYQHVHFFVLENSGFH